MKLSSKEFKNYIESEVKKIALNEGWGIDLNLISENTVKSLNENEFEIINPSDWTKPEEKIEESSKIDIERVNFLNEELKRMRELVDFRNPFFGK